MMYTRTSISIYTIQFQYCLPGGCAMFICSSMFAPRFQLQTGVGSFLPAVFGSQKISGQLGLKLCQRQARPFPNLALCEPRLEQVTKKHFIHATVSFVFSHSLQFNPSKKVLYVSISPFSKGGRRV